MNKSKEINNVSNNQFGFRNKLSTIHSLFIVNELRKKSKFQHTPLYLCKLDAEKAFDHLWRDGLFYKLMRYMDKKLWCILKSYYDLSIGFLKLNNKIFYNSPIYINRGVKQGGILSPSLFNLYIDQLINDIINTNLGYKIDGYLINIIVYADDVLLIANNISTLQLLLNICHKFSLEWQIKFNPEKCSIMQTGHKIIDNQFIKLILNEKQINVVDEFVYLGLKINSQLNYNETFIDRFIKTEKSYFSLYKFGMKQNGLDPFTKSHIFKTYSLPKCTYAIGLVHLNKNTLKKINIRQNNTIRNMVSVSHICHVSALNRILKIDKFDMMYNKFIISTIRLLKRSPITKGILDDQYNSNINELHKEAFINNVKNCAKTINDDINYILNNENETIKNIKALNKIRDTSFNQNLKNLISNYNFRNIKELNNILMYDTTLITFDISDNTI